MKFAGKKAKWLMQNQYGVDSMSVIDLLESFDSLWCLGRWTANMTANMTVEVFQLQQKIHLKLLMFPINVVTVSCVYSLKNAK